MNARVAQSDLSPEALLKMKNFLNQNFIFKKRFIYLAVLGLIFNMQALSHGIWDLSLLIWD